MSTLGDVWDMERRVMEFYDSLMKESREGGDKTSDTLKATAFQVVMSFRTTQVELINNMARTRELSIAGLALLPDTHGLSSAEASVLRLMKGLFLLHRGEITKAVNMAESKHPKQTGNFRAILEAVRTSTNGSMKGAKHERG